MKTSKLFLATTLLAILPLALHAKIVRVVEKTFTVQPDGLLTVETQGGNIRVETADQTTVKVVATQTIKASSESEADSLLEKLTLTIEQQGQGVTATSKYEKKPSGLNWGSWPPVQVNFVVTVPSHYNVKVKTSGGDISVDDLMGKVYARTSGGNVTLGKISQDVDAGTSGGDVRLNEGLASVKLSTSGGNITVERAIGATDLDTSGGDIRIGSVENTVHASTSGGNVTAGIVGAFKGDCVLDTSGGNVRANVSRDATFNLDASTSGGDVKAEGLTITIEKGGSGRSRLVGKVNGGGPLLKLRSSGGDVSVVTR
ncbi:MAG: DUF4097 family beta strand repeat-containing protein [Opitutus sp.]